MHYLRSVDQSGQSTEGRELLERTLFVWLDAAMRGQIPDELGAPHAEKLGTFMLASPACGRFRVVV